MKVITIGRSSSNDVVINDGSVSRQHCRITCDDYGNFSIVDNSSNGTYVNGVRIGRGSGHALQEMDVIRVGNTTLPWQTYFRDNPIDGITIPSPEPPAAPKSPQVKPDSFLVWSILSIFCCCLPFGIVSTVYASRVDGLWAAGDYAGAIEAASSARTWFWWSFGLGIFINIIALVYYAVVLGAAGLY